jgi:hypothetical protein
MYGDVSAGSRGCSTKDIPVYVVNASSVSDVAAGVNFARKHSVRAVCPSGPTTSDPKNSTKASHRKDPMAQLMPPTWL